MAGRNGVFGGSSSNRRTRNPIAQMLQIQGIEHQRVVHENRRLIEDQIALERELAAAQEELHHMNLMIANMRAQWELQSRELVERGMKIGEDLRATEPLKIEVTWLRAEVRRVNAIRKDLYGKVQNLSQDQAKAYTDNQQIPVLRVELDGLNKEMCRARAAVEHEKNTTIEMMTTKQAMEKGLMAMAREADKLRSELANSGDRVRNAGRFIEHNLHNPDANPARNSDGHGLRLGASDKGPSKGSSSAPKGGVENRGRVAVKKWADMH